MHIMRFALNCFALSAYLRTDCVTFVGQKVDTPSLSLSFTAFAEWHCPRRLEETKLPCRNRRTTRLHFARSSIASQAFASRTGGFSRRLVRKDASVLRSIRKAPPRYPMTPATLLYSKRSHGGRGVSSLSFGMDIGRRRLRKGITRP